MKKEDKENIQAALDHLCAAVRETRNLGIDEYNSILELRLIERTEEETNKFGKYFPVGKYVRPIWSNNPERNDGYYDIYVEGDNCMGVLCDVWNFLRRY